MDLPDRLGVQPGAAVGQVVAGDAGDRRVAQAHRLHRLGHPARLVPVELGRLAGVDLAEVAAPGALVAADEEGRLAVLPALVDVGAAGLLADRVQPLPLDQRLQLGVLRAHLRPGLDPRTACARSGSGRCGPRAGASGVPRAAASSLRQGYAARPAPRPGSLTAVDLRIFTEPQQGASYDQLLRLARATEDARLRRVLPQRPLPGDGRGRAARPDRRLDHAGRTGPGDLPDPARDAGDRGRRSGCPALLAISVAQVDAMSGGRVELGLGTGWFEAEHSAYGIPFPPVKERFDRLEEQLADRHRAVGGAGALLVRRHALPAGRRAGAAQAGAVAAAGDRRRGRAQADPGAGGAVRGRVQRAVPALGAGGRALPAGPGRRRGGRPDRADDILGGADGVLRPGRGRVPQRAEAIGRDPADLRANGVAGTVAEVVDAIGAYAAVGATRMYLQTLDVDDLDHIELIAAEVSAATAGVAGASRPGRPCGGRPRPGRSPRRPAPAGRARPPARSRRRPGSRTR